MNNDQEEIILEGNKLLAEFDGYKYYEKTKVIGDYETEYIEIFSNKPIKYLFEEKENQYFNRFLQDEGFEYKVCLSYNSDYNDLMRVWFKFKNLDLKLDVNKQQFLIRDYRDYVDLISHLITTTNINYVFERLVEAIKWYNLNINE